MLFRIVIPTEHSQQAQSFNKHIKGNFDVTFQEPFLPSKMQPFAGGAGWNLGSTGMMLQQGCLEFMTWKVQTLAKLGKLLEQEESTIINPHWCFLNSKDLGIFNEFIGKLKRSFKVPYFEIYVL